VRFVIAGLGWWGRSWTEVLQKHSGVQLVGTIDPSAEARQWSSENLGVRHFSDLEGAFKEVDTDAVLVTTPPRLHVPVLMNALEHRKHVLVEKPLAVSPGEIGELLAAVNKSEAKVMVAQGYRFMDSATVLRKALQDGAIGQLQTIRILFRQYVPDILKRDHPLYQLKHSILLDMANHHFDLVCFLSGHNFSKVSAFEYETPENTFANPSSAFCLFTLASGVHVTWDGDWCRNHNRTPWEGDWEFIGSEARMLWRGQRDLLHKNRFLPEVMIERPDGALEKISFKESVLDRRVPVLDHFVDSILHGTQPEPSVWDNVRVLSAVFGCIESIGSRSEVRLNRYEN
jgi:predicted dehydrogenase